MRCGLACFENCVAYIGVENSDDTGIPVCLARFMGENHNVSVVSRVYGVLGTANVVGSVIDSHDFMFVDAVIHK